MDKIPEVPFAPASNKIPDFEILTLESLLQKNRDKHFDHDLCAPQRIHFNLIIFITKGSGTHMVDFQNYPFADGHILFVANRQVQAFDQYGHYEGFLILFTNAFFLSDNKLPFVLPNHGFNFQLASPSLVLKNDKREKFAFIAHELVEEYHHINDDNSHAILKSNLNILLLKLNREMPSDMRLEARKHSAVFHAFQGLLFDHFRQQRNALFYAGQLNISYKHLNAVCKSLAHQSAKEFIDQFIMLEAKRSLASSGISTKELAYALGFGEPTNFAKFFKRHVGMTPASFRKRSAGRQG